MKRRREWILLGASLVVSIAGIVISRREIEHSTSELAAVQARVGAQEDFRQESEIRRFRSYWPAPNQVRQEVRDDPHRVPPSLIRFARILGSELERAHADPSFAIQLLSSLEECVRSTEVIESARAVCLRQSKRIPGFHPSDTRLPIAAARVYEAAPKRVLEIADALDATEWKLE